VVVIVQAPVQAPTIIQQPTPVVVQPPPVYFGYFPAPVAYAILRWFMDVRQSHIWAITGLIEEAPLPVFFCRLWTLSGA
jgi:hypothetical protein